MIGCAITFMIEKTITRIFQTNRSSVRSDYPRGFLKTGFSDLTLMTSSEKVGVVFALLVALRVDNDMKLYYADSVGIIKKEIKNNDYTYSNWDLIRYNVSFFAVE